MRTDQVVIHGRGAGGRVGGMPSPDGAAVEKKVKDRGGRLCHPGCKMTMLLGVSSRIEKEWGGHQTKC